MLHARLIEHAGERLPQTPQSPAPPSAPIDLFRIGLQHQPAFIFLGESVITGEA